MLAAQRSRFRGIPGWGHARRRGCWFPRAAFGVTPKGAMLAARRSRFRGILGWVTCAGSEWA
jgi:hypothetical protein